MGNFRSERTKAGLPHRTAGILEPQLNLDCTYLCNWLHATNNLYQHDVYIYTYTYAYEHTPPFEATKGKVAVAQDTAAMAVGAAVNVM